MYLTDNCCNICVTKVCEIANNVKSILKLSSSKNTVTGGEINQGMKY